MLKKEITYTDYNGVERTESHYFNLSKGEVFEMEATTPGGYFQMLKDVTEAEDLPTLFKLWKEFIVNSYGEKSKDGKRFIKNEELTNNFLQSEAYSNLIVELSTDANAASEFAKGVLPKITE